MIAAHAFIVERRDNHVLARKARAKGSAARQLLAFRMVATTRARKKQRTEPFDWLDLPRELRNMCYGFMLDDSQTTWSPYIDVHTSGGFEFTICHITPTKMFLVNRQFKLELQEMPESMPELHIEDNLEDNHHPFKRFDIPAAARRITKVRYEILSFCYCEDLLGNPHMPGPCSAERDLSRQFQRVADILNQVPDARQVSAYVHVGRNMYAPGCEHAIAARMKVLTKLPDTMTVKLKSVYFEDTRGPDEEDEEGFRNPNQRFEMRWVAVRGAQEDNDE